MKMKSAKKKTRRKSKKERKSERRMNQDKYPLDDYRNKNVDKCNRWGDGLNR